MPLVMNPRSVHENLGRRVIEDTGDGGGVHAHAVRKMEGTANEMLEDRKRRIARKDPGSGERGGREAPAGSGKGFRGSSRDESKSAMNLMEAGSNGIRKV